MEYQYIHMCLKLYNQNQAYLLVSNFVESEAALNIHKKLQ
jgi:hypothetical protein